MLLLGGGGDALLPGLDWLGRVIGTHGTILLVPHAWPSLRFGDCAAMMHRLFKRVGVRSRQVRLARHLAESPTALEDYAAVYLCGGNTFALLAALRRSRFVGVLEAYRRAGGLVAGNSAGAIVLGRTIEHAHDHNDVAMADFSGCDWLDGYAVWCHYHPEEHDREIEAFIRTRGVPVIALADDWAMTVTNPGCVQVVAGAASPLFFRDSRGVLAGSAKASGRSTSMDVQ
jgi:dipeptidase E